MLNVHVFVHGGAKARGLARRRHGVSFFIGGDGGLVNQREAYIVETVPQAMLAKRINLEAVAQASIVGDSLRLQIGGEHVAFPGFRAREKFVHLRVG